MIKPLYEQNQVMVDSTRYIVEGTTYPINSIASVSSYKHDYASQRYTVKNDWINENAQRQKDLKSNAMSKGMYALGAATLLYFLQNVYTAGIFFTTLAFLLYAIYNYLQFEISAEPKGPDDQFSVKIFTSAG